MKSPCVKECPDRSAECRLTCEKWAEYWKWYITRDAERQKLYDHECDYYEHLTATAKKTKVKG